jgi:hypothetical protein
MMSQTSLPKKEASLILVSHSLFSGEMAALSKAKEKKEIKCGT